MSKQKGIVLKGEVQEMNRGLFLVKVLNEGEFEGMLIRCTLSGKMRTKRIRVVVGNIVRIVIPFGSTPKTPSLIGRIFERVNVRRDDSDDEVNED